MQHDGDNRIQPANAGERQADDDELRADSEILVNDSAGTTRKPDQEWQPFSSATRMATAVRSRVTIARRLMSRSANSFQSDVTPRSYRITV